MRGVHPLVDRPVRWNAPTGWSLRERHGWQWLRLHSLPGSVRYPSSTDDYDTLLERHRQVADAVLGECARCWLVVSENPSMSNVDEDAEQFAFSHVQLEDPGEPDVPNHFHVAAVEWRFQVFASLVRARADDETGSVLFARRDREGVYAPYDGGMDVFVRSVPALNAIRSRFATWRSPLASGL